MEFEPTDPQASAATAADRPGRTTLYGLLFIGLGAILLLGALGIRLGQWQVDGPLWLAGALGAMFIVAGLTVMIGPKQAASSKPRGSTIYSGPLLLGCLLGAILLGVFGIVSTSITVMSWMPQHQAAFTGGVTRSIWEHRIVWMVSAVVTDLFVLYAFWGISKQLMRKKAT